MNDMEHRGEETRSPGTLRRRFLLVVALLGLLCALGASSVLADGEESLGSGPSPQEIEASLEGEGPAPEVIDPTDSEAAEQLPHTDLDRGEAADLLSAVFALELEGTAGIFDELEVERFQGDHVALLASGDQFGPETQPDGESHPTLLESTLPLKTENSSGEDAVVDLTLGQIDGGLRPTNPLVEVGVPGQLGEGISLPEAGVEIGLAGAPDERAPSIVEESTAFYPNVAPDSDLSVAPTPLGVETSTQLRSADAPQSQTFNLTLPAGASLREAEGGGAEAVSKDGQPLVVVPAPTALDATGEPVPVQLETAGDSVLITAMPDEDASFPILVDPLWEIFTYGQVGGPRPNYAGWTWETNEPSHFQVAENDWCAACNNVVWGLELNSFPGTVASGSRALWDYRVPRWAEDAVIGKQPTTYITYAMFGRLAYDIGLEQNNHSIANDPIFEYFLWDDSKGFVAIGKRLGSEGSYSDPTFQYKLKNPNANEGAKQAELELVTTQRYSQWRHAYVGDAWIELTDEDYPEIVESSNPTGWVNGVAGGKIGFKVIDAGLGVYELRAWEPTSNGPLQSVGTRQGCTGGAGYPCPREWSSTMGVPALNYDPSIMPQGEDLVTLDASDAGGRLASQKAAEQLEVKIKVDHTPPALALSGNLTEQGTVGTKLSSYALKYRATDGTHAAAEALAPFGTQGTGNGQMQRPLGMASDRAGHIWMVDREGNRVEQFDEAGNYLGQFGSKGSGNGQLLEPSNIVRTAAGNLWVTDTGNHRVEEFNSSGQYVQQFSGSGGAGGAQFLSPYGIAATSDGMLWVGDTGTSRVAEFRETVAQGSERFVRNAVGLPGNPSGIAEFSAPAGLAVDSKNNLWVVDSGHHRLQQFNSKGEYVSQFGSEGITAGTLKTPYNVSISSTGSLFVTDAGNNRIEQFQPSGAFVRQFGVPGSGSGQFKEPRAFAFGAGNTIFVDDAGNHRITRWQNAEFDPQSGAASVQIKVDGNAVSPTDAPGCATRDCEINHEWTLESRQYADGPHTVKVTATDGVGLATTKEISIDLHPDRTPPSLALSGSMTEQATLGTTRPRYILNLKASDPGSGSSIGFASSFGSNGTGNGQLKSPADVAVDSKGNLWVADKANNRIQQFNSKGEYVSKFGSEGTGNGQLKGPSALAIDAKGNIWVVDHGNNRVQEFNEKGEYLFKFGSLGSTNGLLNGPEGIGIDAKGNMYVSDTSRVQKFNEKGEFVKLLGSKGSGAGQISEPGGIDIGPGGNVWIADWGNNRVTVFNEAGEFVRQFGSSGTGNGQFKHPESIDVDGKGNVWVGDHENGRIEEFNQSGEYVAQFGSKGSGAGQFSFTPPMGLDADSAGNIWVADTNNSRVQKWVVSEGGSSGVASTTIKVDGKVVDSTSPGCSAGGCSISLEWILNSSSSSTGQHTAEVTATDASGLSTTKSLTFNIAKDTTAPQITANASLYTAPEGWVEQESYLYTASAADPSGYGNTSLVLKIDGKVVKSTSQTCPDGACGETLSGSIDMAAYEGGAHPAELIATDGAGNAATKKWTVNVDPEGHISTEEATATLEAVEATSPMNPIGEAQEEEGYEGTAPGLGVKEVSGNLEATGTEVPTIIGGETTEGVTMEIPEKGSFAVPCASLENTGEDEPSEPCITPKEFEEKEQEWESGEAGVGLTPIEVVPVGTTPGASASKLIAGVATVAANTKEHVDTVTRPLYDGMMNFETIRDPSAPETITWKVNLAPEQELKQIDDQHAKVGYEGTEQTAVSITAAPARDAIGSRVPTNLSVSGTDEISLTIHHHAPSPAGGSFIYPVVAGDGWEGGFQTYIAEGPRPTPLGEGGEEAEVEEWEELGVNINESLSYARVSLSVQGPPIAHSSISGTIFSHRYKFSECRFALSEIPEIPTAEKIKWLVEIEGNCLREGDKSHLFAGMALRGWYWYKPGKEIWTNANEEDCKKWGPYKPAMVNCEAVPRHDAHHVVLYGNYRFPPGTLANITAAAECDTLWAVLTVAAPHKHERESIPSWVGEGDPCDWPQH